jgi:hypothetical protein
MRGFVVAALLLFAPEAFARCDCRCVDGHAQAACTSSFDVPPVCSQYCPQQQPMTPIGPIDSQVDNGNTTGLCETVMTMNPRTGRYQPRQLCR